MPSPRSVLLVTDRYPPHPGGLARSSQRLAEHAAANGAEVQVLVTRADGPPGSLASAQEGALTVHRLGEMRGLADLGQAASSAVEWLHETSPFELIHGQYASTSGFLAAYQGRRLGIASYVSLRGNDVDRDIHDPSRAAQLLWALSNADAVGGVSRALVSDAARLSGRLDVRYTPNSVDPSTFRPLPANPILRGELGLDDGPVAGFVGELRHKKGAAFILEGFRSLPPDMGCHLLLVGMVRPDERRALDQFLLDEPALASRVHVCGYSHDPQELAALYGVMDVLLSPSLWEGMPNAVLEAMACGRPVLASDAGGIPDLIAHGETGWLLSRRQLHRFGDALQEVLALPNTQREAVGARAREHVCQTFTPARERAELAEAYAATLASHARS